MTLRKAVAWTAFWVLLALAFALGVFLTMGGSAALMWLSAYTIEKLLSFDNLFMFYVIFRFFGTSPDQQRSALNWGIIGSTLFRGLILFTGTLAIAAAPWLLLCCGAFLLWTGAKMLWDKFRSTDDEPGDEQAPEGLIARLRRWLPGIGLFGITIATIELTDVLFALDSIPAAFGITSNFFILATSNLFAVLGLRSMYFVMLEAIKRFHFLEQGVATILSGIGLKMLLAPLITIPTPITFGLVVGVLAIALVLSLAKEYALKPDKPGVPRSFIKAFCTLFFKPPQPQVEEGIELQPLSPYRSNTP